VRLTSRSAIRSLATTHCDSFAQSVGDERKVRRLMCGRFRVSIRASISVLLALFLLLVLAAKPGLFKESALWTSFEIRVIMTASEGTF